MRLDHKKLLKGGGNTPRYKQTPDYKSRYAIADKDLVYDGKIRVDARRERDQSYDTLKALEQRRSALSRSQEFLGGYAEGVTPVPIPNTEVKPLWADGTARVAVWESRSPPGIYIKSPLLIREAGAFFRFETLLIPAQ